MQKLILVSGKEIPVKNVMRWSSKESLEVNIVESELASCGLDLSTVLTLLKDSAETAEMKLVNDADILENVYYNYSKLDGYSVTYDQTISANVSEPEETSDVKETVIVINIKQLSNLEQQVASNTEMVEAMTVAIATMMGE